MVITKHIQYSPTTKELSQLVSRVALAHAMKAYLAWTTRNTGRLKLPVHAHYIHMQLIFVCYKKQ